jgi:hypothetical protein
MFENKYPFTVRTIDEGVFVKGYDEKDAAEKNAQDRNKRARVWGHETRYEATDIPAARGSRD